MGSARHLLYSVAEVAARSTAGGRRAGSYRTILYRSDRRCADSVAGRNSDGCLVRGAIPAHLYSLARPRFPRCEMGAADRRVLPDPRAGRAKVVLAAGFVPLDSGLDRMDAVFDSAENARREVAEATVPMILRPKQRN